ncbi:hypothetical protein SAMN05216223_13169 [Actinacidiphila yanglinensis]|uniref:Arc-like DNA binding domain-containing protein n=1 Tax=Actinacidiphila yanglinensis TaxID=310779 RepID=A0A1H6ED92_9ACTN|nr:hypothetical protein [Actinacidiphila yanglinensis]SEG94926.1 hypothetical protein SAMN05216223_13169 [Actinacidiphila yanglinensis]
MADANVRIPEEARDRLAAVAAAEGMSLRAYLARLAEAVLTPEERAAQAEQARAVLQEWTGYAPGEAEQKGLDAELDARLRQAAAR